MSLEAHSALVTTGMEVGWEDCLKATIVAAFYRTSA